jgi:hypothetical protein
VGTKVTQHSKPAFGHLQYLNQAVRPERTFPLELFEQNRERFYHPGFFLFLRKIVAMRYWHIKPT